MQITTHGFYVEKATKRACQFHAVGNYNFCEGPIDGSSENAGEGVSLTARVAARSGLTGSCLACDGLRGLTLCARQRKTREG